MWEINKKPLDFVLNVCNEKRQVLKILWTLTVCVLKNWREKLMLKKVSWRMAAVCIIIQVREVYSQ
jgi:hypothetical protein